MLNFNRILMTLCITSSMVLAACGATTNSDGDATDGTGSDAAIGTDDISTGGDTTTGDTTAAPKFKSIVLVDKSADPKFINGACGSSPGMDLDAVGLYRGGKLIAVGKVGSANYDKSAATSCSVDAGKAAASAAEGPLDAHVYASKPDDGYISLNGGSIELQFGACTSGSGIKDCDGKGDIVEIMSGDEIDVWEVDTTYKAGSGKPGEGNAYDGCVCYADEYNVSVRLEKGVDAGSLWLPTTGTYAGSTTVTVP